MSIFPAIKDHSELTKAVSARALYNFLEVNRDFSTWITGRIDQFNFSHGEDFIADSIPQNGGKGGRPLVEYFITIDMAKELAMVERNEQGKKVRKYFIECEKKLNDQSPAHILPQTFADALRLAADQQEVIQAQAAQIECQKPAVAFVERYVESTGNLGFRQVCKLLKAKENDFRAFLQDQRIMYRLGGDWVPYASHIDSGRFHVTTGTGDNDHNFTSAKFTPKGVEWVAKLWSEK